MGADHALFRSRGLSPTALRLGEQTEVGQVIVAHPEVEPVDGRSVWTVQLALKHRLPLGDS